MRLDKYLAHATKESRSSIKKWLKEKQFSVNGSIIIDPCYQVPNDANVYWHDEKLALPSLCYIMFNKPIGVICSHEEAGQRTVFDILPPNFFDLHCVGRLDKDSSGLLLLTDDGNFSHRLSAPGKHKKRYRVQTARPLLKDYQEAFTKGILLKGEDKPTRPAELAIINDTEALVWIQEGKYHQVRRMFAALGNHVNTLHREAISTLELDPMLGIGEWRALSESELKNIHIG
jgi:16S rRNA pseudouridine516 synthase